MIVFLTFHAVAFNQPAHPVGQIVPVSPEHAARFGKLLVQDNGGRIEPVNTLSNEILRKIYRKSTYKGLNSDQVILGMMVNPDVWQHEPVIRATHPQIQEILGSDEKYHAFSAFFSGSSIHAAEVILKRHTGKKPHFEVNLTMKLSGLMKESILAYLVFSGDFLRIFPVPGDSTHTWYNHQSIQGKTTHEDSVFVENIFYLYIQDVQKSLQIRQLE